MRVTDRQIFEGAQQRVGAARDRSEKATREASTGIRVSQPGDDPAAAGQIASRRMEATRYDAINKAAGAANDELAATDGALDSLGTALSRARELAVQLSNATYSPAERAAGATEVDGLLKSAIAALNTRVGQRYVFGGFQDGAPPFDAAGNYVGDTGVRKIELAPGVLQDVSVRADVAVKGVGGGVDVLATLQALSTALSTNNVAGIQGSLTGLDTGTVQLATARSTAGSAMTTLDAAQAATRAGKDSALSSLSHLADADIVDASSQLALAERALDASLTASAKSFQLTILSKL